MKKTNTFITIVVVTLILVTLCTVFFYRNHTEGQNFEYTNEVQDIHTDPNVLTTESANDTESLLESDGEMTELPIAQNLVESLADFVVGEQYGVFVLKKNTLSKIYANEYGGKLDFEGYAYLSGYIAIRPEELSGSGEFIDGYGNFVVDFELDAVSQKKIPSLGSDDSSIRVRGLASHPFVLASVKGCSPDVYCKIDKRSGEITILVSGYTWPVVTKEAYSSTELIEIVE